MAADETTPRNRIVRPKKDTSEKKFKHMDASFLLIIFVLLIFGIVMVFSASYASALEEMGNSYHYIIKHLQFVVAGVAAMLVISFIDYHIYRKLAFWVLCGGYALLVLVLIIGDNHGTFATRWIDIGSFSFQPSEIMKFALILFFAHLITTNYSKMGTFRYGVLPFAVCMVLMAVLMMLEPHTSGTIIMLLICLIMMFVGGTKLRYFVAMLGLGGAAVAGIVLLKGTTYVTERVTMWLDPFADPTNAGWQTVQSLIAIGSGGLMGRGIGMSRQKYMYISEPQNDFIFPVICEELGLIGAVLVILLFVLFTWRGLSIAAKAPDKFGFMLALGLTTQIALQAILNIAVVTNTIPNTGISLPFFSYGGTALMMQLGEMGILLNISRQAMIEKT